MIPKLEMSRAETAFGAVAPHVWRACWPTAVLRIERSRLLDDEAPCGVGPRETRRRGDRRGRLPLAGNPWGGVLHRCAPGGLLLASARLPARQPTMRAFAGPGLDEMVVTSAQDKLTAEQLAQELQAGGVFRFRPGVRERRRACVVRSIAIASGTSGALFRSTFTRRRSAAKGPVDERQRICLEAPSGMGP